MDRVMSLPWSEKVVSFQISPESATIADIVRMAEELVTLWEETAEQEAALAARMKAWQKPMK
jgi:hypothetical protein